MRSRRERATDFVRHQNIQGIRPTYRKTFSDDRVMQQQRYIPQTFDLSVVPREPISLLTTIVSERCV